ncbi:methyltransferase domain-containing protein [Streptomyces sp. NPDC059578]|uniref:methyltransferase domain-containing protein n=1 Tax=Streptomyces sp. NPDC059578 TaxID=3346874 RepID=UPI0036B5A8A1
MTTISTASEKARAHLVRSMTDTGALTSPGWTDAFRGVPREAFVPSFQVRHGDQVDTVTAQDPSFYTTVYQDTSLITRWDSGGTAVSSSSEPSLMARMLEAFAVTDTDRVLEVGTGTGYNTALLCHRLGDDQVFSIDIDPELTTTARQSLAAVGYAPHLVTGDGTRGVGARAPYGGILATCGVHRIPAEWVRQVRPGGIIVTNIGTGIVALRAAGDGTATGGFLPDPAAFMIVRPTPEQVAHRAASYTALVINGTGRDSRIDLSDVVQDSRGFYRDLMEGGALEVALTQYDVLSMHLTAGDTNVYGLVHPDTGSWARITPTGEFTTDVAVGGPRDLWAERATLTAQWIAVGRPGPGAYTLTVEPDDAHALRHDEPATTSWRL